MARIDIPSIDPLQYKPKAIFGLTMRQAIIVACGGIAVIIGANTGSKDTAVTLGVFSAVIAYLFGWKFPYGMPTEKYIMLYIENNVMNKSKRILKTDSATDTQLKSLHSKKKK